MHHFKNLIATLILSFTMVGLVSAQSPGPVSASGNVLFGTVPLCALVLINGQSDFSCDGKGHFDLANIPLDGNGDGEVQVFASGFAPQRFKVKPTGSPPVISLPEIQLVRVVQGRTFQVVDNYQLSPQGGTVIVSGTVKSGTTPVCALVLANGQKMFSCGNDLGNFSLEVPIDESGNITLQIFADGFEPFRTTTAAPKAGESSVSGIVRSGVLILADADGRIYKVASTFGDSLERAPNGPGGAKRSRFSFTELPSGVDFRLFLITEAKIWSVYGDANGPGQGRFNVFALEEKASIDIGLIESREVTNGKLLSEFNIFDQNGVIAKREDVRIPIGIERPSTFGLNEEQLLDLGMGALFSGWTGGANTYLDKIVLSTAPGSSNNADAARFFLALSTLVTPAFETPSDGDASVLNRISDILDIVGIPNDEKRGNLDWIDVPVNFTVDDATTDRSADFFDSELRGNLFRSATLLGEVSASYSKTWVRPDNEETVENDFSDALFFLGLVQLLQTQVAIGDAYNLEFDPGELIKLEFDSDPNNDETAESFLAGHPDFLAIKNRSHLMTAGNLLANEAIISLERAIDAMESESDSQSDDLIRLTSTPFDTVDVSRTRSYLTGVKQSIQQGSTVVDTNKDPSKNLVLDLFRFFNDGVDFRGKLPAVLGDELSPNQPCLPDPSFNGVIQSPDVNIAIYGQGVCP